VVVSSSPYLLSSPLLSSCSLGNAGFFDGAASDWSDLNLIPTLERGWAFVSVEYRLVPQVGLEEQVEDVKNAVRFVREELGERMGEKKVDGKRIAVSGSSAGTLSYSHSR